MSEKIVTSNWSTDTKELYEQLEQLYKQAKELRQDPDTDCQKAYFRTINAIRPERIKEQLTNYLKEHERTEAIHGTIDTDTYTEHFVISTMMHLADKSQGELIRLVENIT